MSLNIEKSNKSDTVWNSIDFQESDARMTIDGGSTHFASVSIHETSLKEIKHVLKEDYNFEYRDQSLLVTLF